MRIVVVSCWKYRDCWKPFIELYRRFWPGAPHVTLLTDVWDGQGANFDTELPMGDVPWCEIVSDFAGMLTGVNTPILLLQEDFFLNAPVNTELIEHGLKILSRDNVGAVRLYPCPGSNVETDDPYFGRVERHTAYRNSLQATLYRPEYLHTIASRFNTPAEFEIEGSAWASQHLPAEVWAFKREVQPWPLSYLCSAIGRGLWSHDAKKLCDQHGIEVDWSLRGFQAS